MVFLNGSLAPFHRVADPRSTYPQSLRHLIFWCHTSQPERLSWNHVHQEFRTRDAKDCFYIKKTKRDSPDGGEPLFVFLRSSQLEKIVVEPKIARQLRMKRGDQQPARGRGNGRAVRQTGDDLRGRPDF
jgi:hypothetical protein